MTDHRRLEQLKHEIDVMRRQLARIDADAGPFTTEKRELRERLQRLEAEYGILYGQLAVQGGDS